MKSTCRVGLVGLLAACAWCAEFDVKTFGAAGDGQKKDTAAIARAIDAAAKAGGGTVVVSPGRYLTGALTLKSNVTLEVEAGATLLGSPDPEDYPLRENVWGEKKEYSSLIYADGAEHITIRGRGTIDGQGQAWWKRMGWPDRRKIAPEQRTAAERAELAKLEYGRPHMIKLVRSRHVVIEGLHLINSASWTVNPLLCEFVRIDGITIENPVPSPNTDGINPESCRNVQILNSRIDVGDDCVTLKSGKDEAGRRVGRPDENITITNCVMLKGHGAVTIGSEMSGGVRNVVVSNCVFQGTDVGIRVKSQRGRGGIVEGFVVSNVVMQDVVSAFTLTSFYSGTDKPGDLFPVGEGTPRLRDFRFGNITARGSKTAGQITGLKEMPIENITFTGVRIQAQTGMKITNAKDVTFQDVVIEAEKGDAVSVVDSMGIELGRLLGRR
ncbi:MAG TPA: glycoside hydrolase family 28 protein [Candidatus Solibacter sp.]